MARLNDENLQALKDGIYRCSNAVRMSAQNATDLIETIEAQQQEIEQLKYGKYGVEYYRKEIEQLKLAQVTHHCANCERMAGEIEQLKAALDKAREALKIFEKVATLLENEKKKAGIFSGEVTAWKWKEKARVAITAIDEAREE